MTKLDKGTRYARIAAILFAVAAIYTLAVFIHCEKSGYIGFYVQRHFGIESAILLALVITIYTKSEKAIVPVAVADAALYLWQYICDVRVNHLFVRPLALVPLFIFFAYASLAIIVVLVLRRDTSVKKIWFLMAALLFIGHALYHCYWWHSFIRISVIIQLQDWSRDYWLVGFFVHIAEIVALVFVGLWIKEEAASIVPVVKVPQTVSKASEILGGADKLKTYKELLDCGAITQAEFDAKKKEILGW